MADGNYNNDIDIDMGSIGPADTTRNWSELCIDILRVIMDQFSAIDDIVRFGAVCRPWLPISVEKQQHLSKANPWLMLAGKKDSDTRGFFSLSTKKVYHLNLPEARRQQCWSSYGWLITFGWDDMEIRLLNPFSRVQIRLPRLCIFIVKVIMSSTPSLEHNDEKCVVMAIHQGRKLAFLRLGDEVWTPVAIGRYRGFQDIIYFNGQFYAVASRGNLWICDISSPHPKTIELAKRQESMNPCTYNYLVESRGELFLVSRDLHETTDWTSSDEILETDGFDVYKFNFDDRKWTQVKSLDNCALFVGNNASFAIFPSDHPGCGCEPNCIYFTHDDQLSLAYEDGAGHDMGVFWMETREFEQHYVGPDIDILSDFCKPLWPPRLLCKRGCLWIC